MDRRSLIYKGKNSKSCEPLASNPGKRPVAGGFYCLRIRAALVAPARPVEPLKSGCSTASREGGFVKAAEYFGSHTIAGVWDQLSEDTPVKLSARLVKSIR